MDITKVTAFAGRTLQSLSAGERQRVFLARALAQSPRLLLLDEASSFLDIGQELGLFRVIDRLRRERGLTVLTVSHDLNLIGTFCQRVVLVKEGSVQGAGPIEEHYTSGSLTALFGAEVCASQRVGGGIIVSW
jgi:iron complex transport system ATP-binding protein